MTTTSIGVQELRKRIGEKAKADPEHRFWGLYTHVWKLDVLREAHRLARKNNGAPGVDGVNFKQLEDQGVEAFLEQLSQELVRRRTNRSPADRWTSRRTGARRGDSGSQPSAIGWCKVRWSSS